ncbi:MAG: cysteine desulfurase NifS, partial [Anaerolineae bacterium]
AEEIERVIEAVPPIVAQLRKLSPYWDPAANAPVADPKQAFQPAYA